VGVILTGMGRDGVNGLYSLHAAGGIVLAQDEASSAVFGMPGAPVAEGLVDRALPLDGIADTLLALAAWKGDTASDLSPQPPGGSGA
jgi:two-component system chemotaxis response regulator CheB